MLKTAESLINELNRLQMKYKEAHDLDDGKSHIACGVTGKTTQVDYHFIFDQDCHSVTMRAFKLFVAPVDRQLPILELMNRFNRDYRWVKFAMDSENWVNLQADAIVNETTSGPICLELMLRAVKIIDDTYPVFMHEVWA